MNLPKKKYLCKNHIECMDGKTGIVVLDSEGMKRLADEMEKALNYDKDFLLTQKINWEISKERFKVIIKFLRGE